MSDDDRSCFLPGTRTQTAWDSTSLTAFKSCPRYYQYTILEGWQPKDESVHLRFGQELHLALQNYEESRAADIPHDEAVFDVVKALMERTFDFRPDPETKVGRYKSREALIRTTIWYLEQYREDTAKTLRLEDGEAAVELSFSFELDWGPESSKEVLTVIPYILCGHLDRVVEFNGETYVMDHKTTTSTPGDYYFAQYEPNNQMSLYTLASQVIFQTAIKGVIIDVIQLLAEESRFTRAPTFRTPDQTQEWMEDLRRWLAKAEACAVEGHWPQNDTACSMYGGCRFRGVCSKSPQARQAFLEADFNQLPEEERWNPLRPR